MDLFTEGQKIALIFVKNSNMVEMLCTIDKIYDDRLELQPPQYFMRYVEYLRDGAKLTAKAFSKLGTIDFSTVVISSPLDTEHPFTIELDYNALKLTPSREQPVINAMELLEVYEENELLKLKTFEISTEFTRFYSDRKFSIDDQVDCAIILPKDYGIIKFKAIISEIDPIYDNEYTATYITMTETARQALLYYMYVYSTEVD